MLRLFTLTVLSLCLFASLAYEVEPNNKVVYGTDDRVDVYELPVSDPFRIIAEQSVAAMVSRALVEQMDSNGRFDTFFSTDKYPDALRLQALLDLCPDQKFLKDPTVALCTATLIAPDKVLTAGYCIDELTCPILSFMFSYYATSRDEEGYPSFPEITEEDIYHCDSVLKTWSVTLDFAIVTLDRPVNNTKYVPVNVTQYTGALEQDLELVLIGFPSGTPAKVSKNGRVTDPRNDTLDYFYSTVDAFGGNGGAGVFTNDLEQVGILVSGNEDYVDNGTCTIVNVIKNCTQSCGELSTYAFHASVPVNFSNVYEGELKCGDNVTGTTVGAPNVVGYLSGERVYDFSLSRAELIDISACQSKFDTVLRVFDGDGLVELEVCDDCGGCGDCSGCNRLSRISAFVPAGHYYVVIEGYGQAEGEYSLSLECRTVPSPSTEPEPTATSSRKKVPTPVL